MTRTVKIVMALINWRMLYTGVQRFTFGISGIRNSGTAAPTDPFSFSMMTSDGF